MKKHTPSCATWLAWDIPLACDCTPVEEPASNLASLAAATERPMRRRTSMDANVEG